MKIEDAFYKASPLIPKIAFHKVMEKLEEIAESDVDYRSDYAKALLRHTEPFPELREGITEFDQLEKHEKLIKNLLADLFPTALSKNEIKAAAIPFFDITFNRTDRFKQILDDAGIDFGVEIRNFSEHQFYVFCCCMILNSYYGQHLDFKKPLFYDIPDSDGVMHHYRILYNADFMELIPTDKAIKLTEKDINQLIDNFDNLALWKNKFPEGSWILKGFGIINLYDATDESAISNLKGNLLVSDDFSEVTEANFEAIFRSIYKIHDLRIGFTEVNTEDNAFTIAPFADIKSHILNGGKKELSCDMSFCSHSLDSMISDRDYLIISDIKQYKIDNPEEAAFADHLLSQDINSAILAPIMKNGRMYGFIELVSSRARELNSINANKLGYVLPFLTDTIERFYSELQNEIDAIIQNEYTAIHHSVYWKFREEAMKHIHKRTTRDAYKEIVFREVYPLYGQIDVKGSSTARNESTEKDLALQVTKLLALFKFIFKQEKLPLIEQHIYELESIALELNKELKADTEATIQGYILNEVHPVLQHFDSPNSLVHEKIADYFGTLDTKIKMVYDSRKDFDETLSVINKHMAAILDEKQAEAQQFFPHYYERFKTDGVEHNLYVGASISPKYNYNPLYLNNLRLWQLQAMCEMENEYYKLKPTLPYELDVTSLILVFSSPISIRFRMDEKRFDVDGTYNARYEVVKKRIDKSNIKGTKERITQKGKVTIVYTQKKEETEYRRYIQFLQHKGMLGNVIETFDVEDLQGVTGLKALRVTVNYSSDEQQKGSYTYEDLLKELSESK